MTVGRSDAAKTWVAPFDLKGFSVIGLVPKDSFLLFSKAAATGCQQAVVTCIALFLLSSPGNVLMRYTQRSTSLIMLEGGHGCP